MTAERIAERGVSRPIALISSRAGSTPANIAGTMRSCDDGTTSISPPARRTRAVVSLRVLRRVAAWALPRPSAIASAKLANRTVNQRNATTGPAKRFSAPDESPRSRMEQDRREDRADLDHEHDRVAGEVHGSSLTKESSTARRTITGPSNSGPGCRRRACSTLGARCLPARREFFGDGHGSSITGSVAPPADQGRGPGRTSAATITIAPTIRPPKSGESVGNVPAVAGTCCLRTSEPPMASTRG